MTSLNDRQLEAVKTVDKNLLVLAGAGSGKTRVITAKIIHLIQDLGVRPYNILAITFTNKAAGEMKSRVLPGVDPAEARSLHVRTFHSFGAVLLRTFIKALPPYDNNFSIIDPDDQKKIMKELCKKEDVSDQGRRSILDFISTWKNDFIYPDDPSDCFKVYDYGSRKGSFYLDYYRAYQEYLQKNNLLDFDDLIALPVKIMRRHEPCADYVAGRWKYVLIDEYQDTNIAQEKLIEFFNEKGAALTAVGDDDQSIYSFRGAYIGNILGFEKKYKNTGVIMLDQNYRSRSAILDVANDIISNNRRPYDKVLFTEKEKGDYPEFIYFDRDWEEAGWVAENITNSLMADLGETAVFYRMNYQSRVLEELMIKENIPYQIIGGVKFFQRKEVKDLLAYLALVVNPRDRVSFTRVINFPPRGLGTKSVEKILEVLDAGDEAVMDILDSESVLSVPGSKGRKGLKDFSAAVQDAKENMDREPLSQLVKQLAEDSGIMSYYEGIEDGFEREERTGNLYQFFEAAADYEKEEDEPSLAGFLEKVSLVSELDDLEDEDSRVKLMTVHNAKGLEFNNVFVTGMESGNFPHHLSMHLGEDLEEERRLFYVAVTRARNRLFLSGARSRMRYGQGTISDISEFIGEIDKSHFKYYNAGSSSISTNIIEEDGERIIDLDDEHEYF